MDMTLPADLARELDEPMPSASAAAVARLLEYERGHCIALPQHTTLEVLDEPKVIDVPGAAYYCTGLTQWQGNWLPVLDLQVLFRAYRPDYARPARYLLVVAYQPEPGQPLRHGVISLPGLPVTVAVSDSAQCALPDDCDLWSLLALSCFEHEGRAVPILDTARLFTRYHG
jgi:CheW-like domain